MASARTRYEILGHLASGGMGEILLARRLGPAGFAKQVVLKRPLHATTRAHATALVDEARLLARINHPNVCQVHDLEEGDAGYFLVLEYLEGMSWWTLLVETERAAVALPPGALCGLIEQVCDGLEAIHGLTARDGRPAGIVHRDISPGNLFATETGFAKILDLGIARNDEGDPTTPGLGPRGKLPYLSPEQVAGHAVDRRADLFALGLVLYDLARGQRPAPDRVGALAAPELALDALPAPLAGVIRTAVEIDPARRFATASAMAAAVRRAGSALGSSFGRAELAAWLPAQFAGVLAARRAQLPGAAPEMPSVTRRVELRSLVHDPGVGGGDDGEDATVVDGPPGPAGDPAVASDAAVDEPGNATAELAPPPPLIRERGHPAVGQVEALVAAHTGPPRRRSGRALRIAVVAAATLAVALGAAMWWRSTAQPSRPAPPVAAAVEAPAVPPSAATATPTENAPGSAPHTLPPGATEPQSPALAPSSSAPVSIAPAGTPASVPDTRPRAPIAGPAAPPPGAPAPGTAPPPSASAPGTALPPSAPAPGTAPPPGAPGPGTAPPPSAPAPGTAPPPSAPATGPAAAPRAPAPASPPSAPASAAAAHPSSALVAAPSPGASAPPRAGREPASPARRATPPGHGGASAEPAGPKSGRLSVDSDPFAVIELDGKSLGATPLYQVPVAAGRHQLRAETGNGRVQRRAIDVAPGAVAAVVLRWAAGAADDAR